MLEIDRQNWRYIRIKEEVPEQADPPIPYTHWWRKFKTQQKVSKDKKTVVRTVSFHQVKSLKDQAREIEEEHLIHLKEKKRFRRNIRVAWKYDLRASAHEWTAIDKIADISNNKLPVLTG